MLSEYRKKTTSAIALCTKALCTPAVLFRLGIQNVEKGINAVVHNEDFNIDENALEYGAAAFVNFVLANQNGMDMEMLYACDEREGINFKRK